MGGRIPDRIQVFSDQNLAVVVLKLGTGEGSNRSLPKENIQHLKTGNFLTFFFYSVGNFAFLDLDSSGSLDPGDHKEMSSILADQ